jgi:hypothetical protein
MKSILDPTFRYTPSFSTDIRETFARARRESRKDASPPLPQKCGQGTVASIVGRIPRIPARGA